MPRAGEPRPKELGPKYLGDGVYVSFDGYYLWLRTNLADETTGKLSVHEIALEPSMLGQLISIHALFLTQVQELETKAQS